MHALGFGVPRVLSDDSAFHTNSTTIAEAEEDGSESDDGDGDPGPISGSEEGDSNDEDALRTARMQLQRAMEDHDSDDNALDYSDDDGESGNRSAHPDTAPPVAASGSGMGSSVSSGSGFYSVIATGLPDQVQQGQHQPHQQQEHTEVVSRGGVYSTIVLAPGQSLGTSTVHSLLYSLFGTPAKIPQI